MASSVPTGITLSIPRSPIAGSSSARRSLWTRVRQAWCDAPSRRVALRYLLEYTALRTWELAIGCFSIDTNLRNARTMGRVWWLLFKRHRDRALDNLRPALGDRYSESQLRDIARRSFEHFAQLYLVELMMTPRLITHWRWQHYVELEGIHDALDEIRGGRGALMVTPHFGNYELLGYTICKLGLSITAIMRPPDNPLLNEFLIETRRASGLELLHKKGAMKSAENVLRNGGVLGFIGDQDAGRKGVFADFFGRPASWYKSIGLMAMRYKLPILVGCAARVRQGYRYRICVQRIIRPEDWADQDQPLQWITQAFAAGMEDAIRKWPEQYLWMHRRWKSQPRSKS